MTRDAELEAYWRESRGWDNDRLARLQRTERRAWWTAAAGWLCAMSCAGAVAALMPLKQIAPFMVRVDNSTGIVDVVPLAAGRMDPGELVTRYLLSHYVTTCERFILATAESDYEECGAFHSALRNQLWYAQWNRANPSSPLNLYKDGTTVRATVVSVSFFRRASGLGDLAQVRYVKRLRRADGPAEEVTHWIATVQYAYGEPSQDLRTRSLNPLGFRVLDFRPEPEVIGEAGAVGGVHPLPAARGALR
ncbi:MAG TPA: type IV secretion system protein [Steroidobacteraceae bacterium]|nr:type IV secretion system protein [Steroidobacteraceae bacterium]